MAELVLFIGAAALGTWARWAASRWNWAAPISLPELPWGTLAVNVVGSFLLGWAVAADFSELTVVGVGALGSLTTMSTLTHESLRLAGGRRHARAVLYLTTTLALGLVAAWLGLELGG